VVGRVHDRHRLAVEPVAVVAAVVRHTRHDSHTFGSGKSL
jgi:hypothetical protein